MHNPVFKIDNLFQDFRSEAERSATSGDRRDGKVYRYTESLVRAINVALVTGRPLLLRGAPGNGKSSVAHNIARVLKRPYYEKVVESRLEATDLMWRFDTVRRLSDAHDGGLRALIEQSGSSDLRCGYYPYIQPEILWWVFDRDSAKRRGLPAERGLYFPEAIDPVHYAPGQDSNGAPDSEALSPPPVVLLDEIDKAEPDVPNNLLVALGSNEFTVHEIQRTIRSRHRDRAEPEDRPLLIITTNQERQLPPAFLRRCVIHLFEPMSRADLRALIVQVEGQDQDSLYDRVLDALERVATEREDGDKSSVSIAESLDAVRAARRLAGSNAELLEQIVTLASRKRGFEEL